MARELMHIFTVSDQVFPASGTLVVNATDVNVVTDAYVISISGQAALGSPYIVEVVDVALDTGAQTNSISLVAFDTASGTLEAVTGTLNLDITILAMGE